MRRVFDKLKDESGISLLYGLAFLILALMVTGVMLAASMTAVQRLHSDQQREQNTLTLSSAGNLLRSYLNDTACVVTVTTNNDTGGSSAEVELPVQGELDDVFDAAIVTAAGAPSDFDPVAKPPADAKGDFQIKVQTAESAGSLSGSVVDVSYVLTKRDPALEEQQWYNFNAVLSLEGSDQKMYLYCGPTKHELEATSDENLEHVTNRYVWESKNVNLTTRQES